MSRVAEGRAFTIEKEWMKPDHNRHVVGNAWPLLLSLDDDSMVCIIPITKTV